MLKLENINKDYISGDTTVHALKNINIEFRESEFVSILGQSGGGKSLPRILRIEIGMLTEIILLVLFFKITI